MPPSRDWLAAFHCLFSIIPDEPPRDLIRHALVPSLRSWKSDTPRVLYNECHHVEGEITWAGVCALRATLFACAQAINSGHIDTVEALPKATGLVWVLVHAFPLYVRGNKWTSSATRASGPLDHTVGDYLRDYWPTHDMNGAVVPVQRWNSWYNTISTRGLMSYINNAEPADKTAFRLTIFATMQWAYYSLWCGRISWQEMPTSADLKDSMIDQTVLTFHATPGEIGWANDVGVDIAFINRHLLQQMGTRWTPRQGEVPRFLQPPPTLTGHTGWQQHSLLKPQLGYRMRRIYGVDV
ncbi:hypothetical protein NBRC10513v2_005572 [Rhodotorula toruloides]